MKNQGIISHHFKLSKNKRKKELFKRKLYFLGSKLPSGMAGCPPGAAPVVPWAPISDGTGASAALNFLAASGKKTQFLKSI